MDQMEQAAKKETTKAAPVRCTDIMLDLETLATTPDAAIVSIGAVKFTLDGYIDDAAFYTAVTLDGQNNRHISAGTLAWWMTQSDEARKVFNDENRMSLEMALHALMAWVKDDTLKLWSNGADFDIPLINHALHTYKLPQLVRYSNHRCFRTLKNIFTQVPPTPFDGVQHNALADAIHQAKHVQAIHKWRVSGVVDAPPKPSWGGSK